MLTDEQKSRLSPEQLVIAEKWEQEKEERGVYIEDMRVANEAKDIEAYHAAFEKFIKVGAANADYCEHERSIWSSCSACEEIEMILYPEFYNADGERMEDEEIDKMIFSKSKQY
jgi:hypothetical protein